MIIAADYLLLCGLTAYRVVGSAVAGHIHAHVGRGFIRRSTVYLREYSIEHGEYLDIAVIVYHRFTISLKVERSIMFTSSRSTVAASYAMFTGVL